MRRRCGERMNHDATSIASSGTATTGMVAAPSTSKIDSVASLASFLLGAWAPGVITVRTVRMMRQDACR